ncbi:MAG: hypothetical protein ACU85E_09085 [Gammaproteobacteria bacterium]
MPGQLFGQLLFGAETGLHLVYYREDLYRLAMIKAGMGRTVVELSLVHRSCRKDSIYAEQFGRWSLTYIRQNDDVFKSKPKNEQRLKNVLPFSDFGKDV